MNDVNQHQADAVQKLRAEGYSIRDIAAELTLRKSQVEKTLNDQRSLAGPRPTATLADPPPTTTAQPLPAPLPMADHDLTEREQRLTAMQTQLEAHRQQLNVRAATLAEQERQLTSQSNRFAMTLDEHNRKLAELAGRERALAQEKAQLERQYDELEQVLRSLPDEEEQYQAFRIRDRQEKLVSRYNWLVQELLDNSDDCVWSGIEVDDYLERAESLKDKVAVFAEQNGIEPETLLIYWGLTALIHNVEVRAAEQTSGLFSGTSVTVDFDTDGHATIQTWLVSAFGDAAPVPMITEDRAYDE